MVVSALRIMRFWLDMGVDGFLLHAIPYLVEREGTNNENLSRNPRADVLEELRANRCLLSESLPAGRGQSVA